MFESVMDLISVVSSLVSPPEAVLFESGIDVILVVSSLVRPLCPSRVELPVPRSDSMSIQLSCFPIYRYDAPRLIHSFDATSF